MRGGVRIGSYQKDAGLAESQFRPRNMENALSVVAPTEPGNFIFVGVVD